MEYSLNIKKKKIFLFGLLCFQNKTCRGLLVMLCKLLSTVGIIFTLHAFNGHCKCAQIFFKAILCWLSNNTSYQEVFPGQIQDKKLT